MPLTVKEAAAFKPAAKPYKRFDDRGLYLLVHPTGAKYWRLKYTHAGKEKTLALGTYPEISLTEARDKRDEARRKIRDGVDPIAERRAAKAQAATEASNTFEGIAREWYATKAAGWSAHHKSDVLISLEKEILPTLGKRPLAEVTTLEVLALLRKIEGRPAHEVARRVRQRVSAVFAYAIATGRAEGDPAASLSKVLKPAPAVKHFAALQREELPAFLQALRSDSGHCLTRMAMRLLILTACRTGELRYARWSEFDLSAATWTIPAERMKARKAHVIPLSTQALECLKALRPLAGSQGEVFPGQNRGGAVLCENALLALIKRMGYHRRCTGHGFRSTFSTIANEAGWRTDVIEAALAHTERNEVRAAYNRSTYLEERRELMTWWADLIDDLERGGNVVPLRLSRAA